MPEALTQSRMEWAECPQSHGLAFPRLGSGPAGLVLLGPLHSEERVHRRWLPLGVAKGLLLAVLLGPGPRPGRGSQAAGPGQRVQAWWEHVGSAGPGVSAAATGLGADLPKGGPATHWVPWVLRTHECQATNT